MLKKSFYVATAIPYVNDKPHLGHALLFTYGDVLARYYRNLDYQVAFSVGTDEHGGKIAQKAAEKNLKPQAFVDEIVLSFKKAVEHLKISSTHFIRTTDTDHQKICQLIWQNLNDYIYKSSYKGWYCKGCESHKTPTIVKQTNNVCPDHNLKYEFLSEENYFFKLTAFKDILIQKIKSDELRIIPKAAKNETLSLLNEITDISISRPKDNLNWGIGVPGDANQVIYVWFEALMNYITVLKYPSGDDFKTYWPANVQIIGRDILRFHAIIWPAMLLGLKLPLYKTLYVHGLVTVDGQKMSKTLGNSLDPLKIIEDYSLDAFRYFFLRHLPAYDNGDFNLKRFVAVYNDELVDQWGNLVYRLQGLVMQKLNGHLPQKTGQQFFNPTLGDDLNLAFANCHFNLALNLIFSEIKATNKAIETKKPWLIKDGKELALFLDQLSFNVKTLNQFLKPFIPDLSQQIATIFTTNPLTPLNQPPLLKIDV